MIGAVCYKVTNEYEVRIYMVGTYEQIDWTNKLPCVLGENYYSCNLKNDTAGNSTIQVVYGLDGEYVLRLFETKRYVLRLVYNDNLNIELPSFQNENNKFLKLEKDKDCITFQFINYLGYSRVNFVHNNCKQQIVFEVAPEKMDYEEDYIALTEAIAQVCAELLLEYSGLTSNLFSQSDEVSKTVLEQFIFLRQFCYSQNLYSVFEAIKRNPDRLLGSNEEFKPIGSGIPSKKFFTNPFSYGRGWQNIKRDDGTYGFVPQMISVTQKHDSIDTPANRFVKYALERFDTVCLELIQSLNSAGGTKQAECLSEAKAIHNMLDEIFNDGFFDEIGKLDIMPQNNQVLQKREGYSQIFSAYSMIDLALRLDWSGQDEIYEGESKNVALLYEYWLFFELFKIINSIEGCKQVALKNDDFLTVSDGGVTISLQEGKKSRQSFVIERLHTKINLYYNRTFSRTEFKTTLYEGSYSRPFRPDYTIAIFPDSYNKGHNNGEMEAVKNGAVSYIHFDAKYRVTDLTSLVGKRTDALDDVEFVEDKADAVMNTYKRGDLLKMHTYNDAIRRTIGSFILYPGNSDSEETKGISYRLYDEILPGVGAFAIRPSIDEEGENELRDFITELLESKGALYSRLNRMKHYTEMVLREPSVSPLNITNYTTDKKDSKGKSGEQCVLGYIRASKKEDYYYSLVENNLLITGAEFLFYFYAIKDAHVYSHHPDIFKTKRFCFYKNSIEDTPKYIPESVICEIESNELISKAELVERLNLQGYKTDEGKHHADFYYVLKVKVVDDACVLNEMGVSQISLQNGNDAYSPHSPKIFYLERLN